MFCWVIVLLQNLLQNLTYPVSKMLAENRQTGSRFSQKMSAN